MSAPDASSGDYEPDFDEAEFDQFDESDAQPDFEEETEFDSDVDGRHPGHGQGPGHASGPRLAPGPKHGPGHPAPPHEHGAGPKKHAPGAKKAGPKKAPGPKKHPGPPHEHGPGHHPRPPHKHGPGHHPGEPGVEPDFGFGPGTGFGSGPVAGFGLGFGFGQTGRGRQRGFGRGHRGRPGDVRAAILTLLAERPMHGYEMIKEIAGRSHDVWRPSPGSVYPTLQMLNDEGLIGGSESEGSKRLFELTQEGRAAVEKIKAPPWEEIALDADRSQVNIREALGQVVAAVTQSAYVATTEQQQRIVALLKKLRREIYSMLAECD